MAASSASSVASACSSTDAKIEPGSKRSKAVFMDGLLVQENANKRKVRAEVPCEEAMWKAKWEEVQAEKVEVMAKTVETRAKLEEVQAEKVEVMAKLEEVQAEKVEVMAKTVETRAKLEEVQAEKVEVMAKTVEVQAKLKRLKMQLALVEKETEAIRLDRSMSGAVGRLSARAQELTLQ